MHDHAQSERDRQESEARQSRVDLQKERETNASLKERIGELEMELRLTRMAASLAKHHTPNEWDRYIENQKREDLRRLGLEP